MKNGEGRKECSRQNVDIIKNSFLWLQSSFLMTNLILSLIRAVPTLKQKIGEKNKNKLTKRSDSLF